MYKSTNFCLLYLELCFNCSFARSGLDNAERYHCNVLGYTILLLYSHFSPYPQNSMILNYTVYGSKNIIDELLMQLFFALVDWWDGFPLKDISYGPTTQPVLPTLERSCNHSVLFSAVGGVFWPFPDQFRDVWDSKHVRMPCSQQCLYPVENPADGSKSLQSRWVLICQSLQEQISNSHDLEKAIMRYNSVYSNKWNFDGLHSFFAQLTENESSSFFSKVLPRLITLALQLPKLVTHAVPLLRKHEQHAVSCTQQQVACLLANAFLCTFPRRNTSTLTAEYSSYPSINFNTLFASDVRGA